MLKRFLFLFILFVCNSYAADLVLQNVTKDQIAKGFERSEDSLPFSHSRGLGSSRNLDPVPSTPPKPVAQSFNILFEFDSSSISVDSVGLANEIAMAINEPKLINSKFKIEGHTDRVGTYDYNISLSERRAESVKTFMIRHGVAPNRLSTEGKGYNELNEPQNPTAASNRRVKIIRLD
jgi:outer membrane protein OmpA-like peptidoglycan-associated protein